MLKPESYDLKYYPQFWFHTHTKCSRNLKWSTSPKYSSL